MREIKSSKAAAKLPDGTRILITSAHVGTVSKGELIPGLPVNDDRIESDSAGDYYFDEREIEDARSNGTRFYVID